MTFALVQGGWIDLSNTGAGNMSTWADEYWIVTSTSQNQHCGRDGTIRGAKLRITDSTRVTAIYFCALRLVSGTTYQVVGKSEEITTGFSNALLTFTFTTPIRGVRSGDLFAVGCKANATGENYLKYKSAVSAAAPIDDSATAKIRWHDSNNADYAAVAAGAEIALGGGGSVWGVIDMAPLFDPPVVAVVGDSVSEGSPLNRSYRNNATAKDRTGTYLGRLLRDFLGAGFELLGNSQSSNNANEVANNDLTATVWARAPRVLWLHVGVNDIADGRSWAQHEADLDTILAACATNNCQLVLTDIFPWTGNAENTTGTHAQNTTRDTWNASRAAWAATNGVRYVTARSVLGQERTVAKSGDPTPTAGNLWDLQTAYDAADGLGVHLSAAGCTAAAAALAGALGRIVYRFTTAKDLYALIFDPAGNVWKLDAWEEMATANWAEYAWPLEEAPEGSRRYVGLWPPAIATAGRYRVELYERAGATPAITDDYVDDFEFDWLGDAQGTLATAAQAEDLAAVKAETALIVADTNELQTDLANGGRMDLLIDGIKAKTDELPASPAAVGSEMGLNAGALTALATAVWAAGTRTLSGFGTLVTDVAAAVWAYVTRTITGGSLTTAPPTAAQVRAEMDANSTKLDAAVSTRLAAASYTAPDNSGIADAQAAAEAAQAAAEAAQTAAEAGATPDAVANAIAAMAGYYDGRGAWNLGKWEVNSRLYVGAVGHVLYVDFGQDLTAATVKRFDVLKPDGSVVTWTPTVGNGTVTGGRLSYTTLGAVGDTPADLDQAGTWTIQPYVEIGGVKEYRNSVTVQVYARWN